MLHADGLVEFKSLRDQVSVKLVQPLVEESREVLWQLVRLL